MSYWRSCIGGVHVFRMAYLTIHCFFAGRYVLLEDMFFLRVCILGGHVLQFEMSYILLEGMSYRRLCIA